jgi:hypothetical protein
MQTEKLQIADIRYTPERAGFEALVSVHEHGRTYHYPAYVPAPMHAEFALISRRLSRKALRSHRSANPGLRMQLRPLVSQTARHNAPRAA